jgi:putative transcriptional regulator
MIACCCLGAAGPGAAEDLARGRLLVAAQDMQSEIFAESVILLLNYDEQGGAMGLIVNHPTSVPPSEMLSPSEALTRYSGRVYFGGPVEMDTLVALLRADKPPEPALNVVGRIYVVSPEKSLAAGADASRLRFYLGYAGWAPGQLEHEIARGDWHVRAATEDLVFATDPRGVWGKLAQPRALQAAL